MRPYTTLDYLAAYKPTTSEMLGARVLVLVPSASTSAMLSLGYENEAIHYESGDNAILRDLFQINLTEGATYYIYSSSFFDPFLLSLHDNQGSFIAVDSGTAYGNDTIRYVAPYTGTYYINASWDQGLASEHKFVYLSVYEDIDTIPPVDTERPTVSAFYPTDEAANVAISSNIVVTFSEAITHGTGNIVLKTVAGEIVATYDAATSSNLSISGSTLTINPTDDLAAGTGYKVEFAAGSIQDLAGNPFAGTTSYNFTTANTLLYATTGNDLLQAQNGTVSYLNGVSGTTGVTVSLALSTAQATGGSGSDTLIGIENLYGTHYADKLTGNSGANSLRGHDGDDLLYGEGGWDFIDGGDGYDTAGFHGPISQYKVWLSDGWINGQHLPDTTGHWMVSTDIGNEGTDTLKNVESLRFADMTVNLGAKQTAASIPAAALKLLQELYVAFFNRVPDADGLQYWVQQVQAGQSIESIAEIFYSAGVQAGAVTGYRADMSHADFVNKIYQNVLGRPEGADAEGLQYWTQALASGSESRGSLVKSILQSAHTFKGNTEWGWVADLLDNKASVADTFAVQMGLGYLTPEDSIREGMAIAAAVTPDSVQAALELIGVTPAQILL